jgi:hypothetical protein
VWLEADAPRVSCVEHGVTVVQLPWARHAARQTRALEDTVAWLATHCSKSAVTELMRIGWRTVGSIIARVMAEIDGQVDRFDPEIGGLDLLGAGGFCVPGKNQACGYACLKFDTRRLVAGVDNIYFYHLLITLHAYCAGGLFDGCRLVHGSRSRCVGILRAAGSQPDGQYCCSEKLR